MTTPIHKYTVYTPKYRNMDEHTYYSIFWMEVVNYFLLCADIISRFTFMSFAHSLDRTSSLSTHLFDGFDFGFSVFSSHLFISLLCLFWLPMAHLRVSIPHHISYIYLFIYRYVGRGVWVCVFVCSFLVSFHILAPTFVYNWWTMITFY